VPSLIAFIHGRKMGTDRTDSEQGADSSGQHVPRQNPPHTAPYYYYPPPPQQRTKSELAFASLPSIIVLSVTAIFGMLAWFGSNMLIPQITGLSESVRVLTETVNNNHAASIESRAELGEKLGKLESNQNGFGNSLATVHTKLEESSNTLVAQVTEVQSGVQKVTGNLDSVQAEVDVVENEVARMSGSVEAASIVTATIDKNAEIIETLSDNATETVNTLSRVEAVMEMAIVEEELKRVVQKLFDDNETLQKNPALMVALWEQRDLLDSIQLTNYVREKSYTISDDNLLVFTRKELTSQLPISFYRSVNPESRIEQNEPDFGAAMAGTADDGELTIVEACKYAEERKRKGCYVYFLARLEKLHPEYSVTDNSVSESAKKKIIEEHQANFES